MAETTGPGAHRVVIIGGGFGGLHAARSLAKAPVAITLLDRRNFHLFQPLLYQVATGGLSPANIAAPLRSLFARQKNATVLMGEAIDIDASGRRVVLSDGSTPYVPYDTLLLAAGVTHSYFGNARWAPLAPGLKTIEDATEIRRRVLVAFEAAERESDQERRRAWLTFAIVGAGPTGVELAGTLGEIAHFTLAREFRSIRPQDARILLVESEDRVLPPYPPDLSAKAARELQRLGVTVLLGTRVEEITPDSVTIRRASGTEVLPTRTVLWAAGVAASPLGQALARATGVALDRAGRVLVEPDLTVAGHPEIFVIGDLALFLDRKGTPLPGVAQVAMQQGRYVARLIERRLGSEASVPPLQSGAAPPFRYRNYGSMATIGRAAAVADFGFLRLDGMLAWLAWLFIHLMYIVQFGNRVLVFVQWAWSYITRNRSARPITGENPLPFDAPVDGSRPGHP
jgi:NADH dehydrogenase